MKICIVGWFVSRIRLVRFPINLSDHNSDEIKNMYELCSSERLLLPSRDGLSPRTLGPLVPRWSWILAFSWTLFNGLEAMGPILGEWLGLYFFLEVNKLFPKKNLVYFLLLLLFVLQGLLVGEKGYFFLETEIKYHRAQN